MRKIEKIVNLAKRRGFIFPSAEIYGGLGAVYDYGPLGVELKNNVKQAWWRAMTANQDIVGLDSAILTPEIVWQASGHLQNFTDPMVDCKKCKQRFRSDLLEEDSGKTLDIIKCPNCGGELTDPRSFNLLMKTELGVVDGQKQDAYLRGETCQGIYLNFLNVMESMRLKPPFGIAQVGKAFRNEVTTKNFVFRMREFEQMEMQYFLSEAQAKEAFGLWKEKRRNWYVNLGITEDHLRFFEHPADKRAHYAREAYDIEYKFDFTDENDGFKEMEGIHYRGDWDLSQHQKFSKQNLSVKDETGQEYIPHIVETSGGVDRATLAFLLEAYEEIEGGRTTTTESSKEVEVVLRLDKRLAPIKVAVLPLSKKPEIQQVALPLFDDLANHFRSQYDETGSIGKRYRRQDEIGTPYCVTVDFDSLDDKKVTVRDRDTMAQERIGLDQVKTYLRDKLES
ncbi:MAG: glycine--tRNA ligase [Candidatus Komeilibacteria bacterium]